MVLVCNMINIDLKQIHSHLKNNKDEIKTVKSVVAFIVKRFLKAVK